MAYAHRWFTPTKISDASWDNFQKDWGKVVARRDLDVLWQQHRAYSWTHSDNVEIGNKDARGGDCTIFKLAQAATGGFSYDTQREPYDAVVCLCLLVAYATLGDEIRIESDGTWEDWKPGRDLYRKIFGYDQTCPWAEGE